MFFYINVTAYPCYFRSQSPLLPEVETKAGKNELGLSAPCPNYAVYFGRTTASRTSFLKYTRHLHTMFIHLVEVDEDGGERNKRSHRARRRGRGHSCFALLRSFGSKRTAFNGNNEKKVMDGPENIGARCISTFVTPNCPSLSVPSDLSLESARLFRSPLSTYGKL